MKTQVLLVEDDQASLLCLTEILTECGMDVTPMSNLTYALTWLRTSRCDIVVLDLNLPESKGLDTLRQVLNRTSVPVVVMSGTPDAETKRKALAMGAQDYLVKGQAGVSEIDRSIRFSLERDRSVRAAIRIKNVTIAIATVGLMVLGAFIVACWIIVSLMPRF